MFGFQETWSMYEDTMELGDEVKRLCICRYLLIDDSWLPKYPALGCSSCCGIEGMQDSAKEAPVPPFSRI